MKRIYFVLISCFALLNLSCEKGNLVDLTYFGEGFKGITFTNSGGGLWSYETVDPSDWCVVDMRDEREESDDPYADGPLNFSFGPAYPNPCYPSTIIRIELPKSMHVKLYIIDNNYNIIKNIVDGYHRAGFYQFNIDFEKIPGGVYRAVIEADNIKCTGDIWVYRPEF
jgi:hypothetical protein